MNPRTIPDYGSATRALAVEGLTKRYPGTSVPAVADVELSLAPGEVLAVLGESGCGKSTLLRLVAGLEVPDAGTVRIESDAVAGPRDWVPPERRGVGMVFQDFALFPHLRVSDNVMFGLRAVPRRLRPDRALAMLEIVGLADLAGRFPHQLSGGQQQRVALARALAPEPRLLLLDEPFSNLDTPLKATLRDEVAAVLARTGVPTLMVVHDIEDVFALANRVAVMRAGRVLQAGTPEALYMHPADEYVARFFGEANLLPACARDGGFDTPCGFVAAPAHAGSAHSATAHAANGGGHEAPWVLLRPEDIIVSDCPQDGFPAVIRRIQPVGLHQRLILAVETGGTPGRDITAIIDRGTRFSPGDRVYLSARSERATILCPAGCECGLRPARRPAEVGA